MPTSWPSIVCLHVGRSMTFAMPQSSSFTRRERRIVGVVDQEHVVELEVAVDDAGGVRGDQRVADLEQDRDHLVGQDLALVGAQSPSGTPSRRSITMYGPAVGQRAGLEDVDDVRVADLVDDPRLEQHALDVDAGRRGAGGA